MKEKEKTECSTPNHYIMRWRCLLHLPGRSFTHHWSGTGAACWCGAWAHSASLLSPRCSQVFITLVKNDVQTPLNIWFRIYFPESQLCREISISDIIIKCNVGLRAVPTHLIWTQLIRVFDVGHVSYWTNTGRGEVGGGVQIWPPQSVVLNCGYPSQWYYNINSIKTWIKRYNLLQKYIIENVICNMLAISLRYSWSNTVLLRSWHR